MKHEVIQRIEKLEEEVKDLKEVVKELTERIGNQSLSHSHSPAYLAGLSERG